MSYLRGAAMKVGQMLGQLPRYRPAMSLFKRWSNCTSTRRRCTGRCLREMVHNELGDDPENIFRIVRQRGRSRRPSLGQVHRAHLKTGERGRSQDSVPRHRPHDRAKIFATCNCSCCRPGWARIGGTHENSSTTSGSGSSGRPTTSARPPRCKKSDRCFATTKASSFRRVFPAMLDGPGADNGADRRRAPRSVPRVRSSQEDRNKFATEDGSGVVSDDVRRPNALSGLPSGQFHFLDDGRVGVIDFGCMIEFDDTCGTCSARWIAR